jgi:hypothetical protein
MRKHEGRFEFAINLDKLQSRRGNIRESSVRDVTRKKVRSEQLCTGRHFFSAHGGKIPSRFDRLAFVSATEHANGYCRAVVSRSRQCPGAKKLRIIRMRYHSQKTFAFETQLHPERHRN